MLLLSHPTGNQNVRHVLAALRSAGQLGLFYTTLGGARGGGAAWIPRRWQAEWDRRAYDLPSALIRRHPLREVARVLATRANWKFPVRDEFGIFCIDAVYRDLDAAVAANLKKLAARLGLTGVYGYEYACEYTFSAAASLGLARYYELPIAHWATAQRLLKEEALRCPAWEPTLVGTRDSAQKHERRSRELALADLVVCPSKFVADSLPADIRREKNVLIVPFGSPPFTRNGDGHASRSSGAPCGPLRVLFAGSMTQRKGLADLFAAVKSLNRADIELVVMGSLLAPLQFYRRELPSFIYEPTRPHDDVLALMASCDILCLPSIVEGRALVMQEAMSQELPILITPNTGGEDLVEEGKTGFLVPIRSPEKIADRLAWFADNREETRVMGEAARAKAAAYTWTEYGAKVAKAIQQHLALCS
jgi:glycosyltransferase involved in cell wall biosynthesis